MKCFGLICSIDLEWDNVFRYSNKSTKQSGIKQDMTLRPNLVLKKLTITGESKLIYSLGHLVSRSFKAINLDNEIDSVWWRK